MFKWDFTLPTGEATPVKLVGRPTLLSSRLASLLERQTHNASGLLFLSGRLQSHGLLHFKSEFGSSLYIFLLPFFLSPCVTKGVRLHSSLVEAFR